MQFMALIYSDPAKEPQYGTPEFGPFMAAYKAATDAYVADKVFIAGEPLEPATTATTLRLRDGRVETMDGPFAETKEQLGGFYIFDCETLDQALKYAAMIPTAKYGAVEVRPIMKIEF